MEQRVIGRYALHERISSGGMATVYYGRLLGPVGFSRTVAIKQLHPQFSRDPDFVSMFVDEAHLAARIRHPNVVPVLDVVKHGRELYIVMDYVIGASLAELIGAAARAEAPIPHGVVSAVIGGCLRGLHAAHETTDDAGELLGIVHRDVSPANVLVGKDGLTRVLDFGIAKAVSRAQVTRHGELKGKVGYMAPEQLRSGDVDRRADVYSVAVTLWEMLTRRRAFAGDSDEVFNLRRREHAVLPPPSRHDDALAPFDDVVLRGLAKDPDDRYPTADAFADALEAAAPPATIRDVSRFVAERVGDQVERRSRVSADLDKVASPSEVRAAIRDEVGVSVEDAASFDSPAIDVSTWTDPSLDILALVDEPEPTPPPLEPTTREVPSRSKPPPQPATPPSPPEVPEAEGEEPTTHIIPPKELAESAAIDLVKEVPRATPAWTEAAPTVLATSRERGERSAKPVIVGVALATMASAALALTLLGSEPEPPTPASPPEPSIRVLRPPSKTASAARPAPPAAVPAPPSEPETTPPEAEPSASETAKVAPRASARAPVAKPTSEPGDPFDSLGGRH